MGNNINKLNNKLVTPIYHVAPLTSNKKFCSNFNYLPLSYENGHWAGNGMYFWDNINSAKYWYQLNTKKGKYNNLGHMSISKSVLYVSTNNNELLNLTDKNGINNLNFLFRFIVNLSKDKYPLYIKLKDPDYYAQYLGGKINWVYYIYKNIFGITPFSVVKEFGIYPHQQDYSELFQSLEKSKWPHVTDRIKTIYAVHSPSNVINRHIIKVF